ncbi:hypothetical protein ABIB57_004348 [Devosia sp. UYZn731]
MAGKSPTKVPSNLTFGSRMAGGYPFDLITEMLPS